MSRHRHYPGILVLKTVSDSQTNLGLSCCACTCRCCPALTNRAPLCLCRCRETKDICRSQQTDKPKSVFDYFYEQLYSDKKETGAECNHYNPTSDSCGNADTKPHCLGIGVPHARLAPPNSWNFRNEKEKAELCYGLSAKKPVFRKECNFPIRSEHAHGRKMENGRGQQPLDNVPTTLGIPLGYFEVYLAHETTASEEDTEIGNVCLKETFASPASVGSNVCDSVKSVRNETGRLEVSTQKKHSCRQHGESTHCPRIRSRQGVPDVAKSFASPSRCSRLKVEESTAHKTKAPVNHRKRLEHYGSKYRCESLSRSRSTLRSRSFSCHSSRSASESRSRSRSTSRSRSSSGRSRSRSLTRRSSTLSSPSFRHNGSESDSPSRSPLHRNISRSRSRSTNHTAISVASDRSVRASSVRRRIGSPCHLDKRRITSARRRPVAYRRAASPSSSSTTGSSSSGSSTVSSSGSDSAICWRSRSFAAPTSRHSSTTSLRSGLHSPRRKHEQRSNNSRKHSHKQKRLQRNLVPLIPPPSYTAQYSSLHVVSRSQR